MRLVTGQGPISFQKQMDGREARGEPVMKVRERMGKEGQGPLRGPWREKRDYFSEMNARPLLAFIGITNWLAPES